MPYLPHCPFARRASVFSLLALLTAFCGGVRAQTPPAQEQPAQSGASKPDTEPAKPQAPSSSDNAEVSSHDTPPTFKVRVNLVLVRVVVRDGQGHVVPNLRKEDFLLFDNRKQQVISTLSVETPESHAIPNVTAAAATPEVPDAVAGTNPAIVGLPQRFVAVVFDDQHLAMSDTVFVRDAATRFFGSLAPSDRVGIYTSSGQLTQEYTSDHELLKKALLGVLPRTHASGMQECPDVSYYHADLIENKHDTQALAVATEDAVQCAFNGDERQINAAQALAQAAAGRALAQGDADTEYAYRHIEDVMRRLSAMPEGSTFRMHSGTSQSPPTIVSGRQGTRLPTGLRRNRRRKRSSGNWPTGPEERFFTTATTWTKGCGRPGRRRRSRIFWGFRRRT